MSRSLQLSDLMNKNHEKVVRFEDENSEGSANSERPLYPSQRSLPSSENSSSFGSAFNVICQGFERGSQGIRTLRGSFSFQGPYHQSAKKSGPQETILDPQGPFLQRWNKIFLIACVFAMACDPFFFYIPVIDGKDKCLKLDSTLEIIACTLRTFTDLFYLLHIILQFRTGFVSPSSRVLGRGELVKDQAAIARRYLLSYFFVDVLAVLPCPQMAVLFIIPKISSGGPMTSKGLLKSVIFIQYVPRLIRIYPLYKEVTRTSGIITETEWAGAAFNLFLYMLASHVIGAVWYLFAVDRQGRCWHKSCIGDGCHQLSLYCKDKHHGGNYQFNHSICNLVDPDEIKDPAVFNFGMYYDALQLEVVQSTNFFTKLCYCFWWGLRNLSSLGQNLKTSTFIGENLFATFICIAGLVLFSLLIGNMQKYLQSTTLRVEEMRIRRRDAEQWMSHRLLPEDMRQRIRRYEQYNWQETRGVDEERVIRNLPRDLRRDIKRHLCLNSLTRVPMFAKMDEQLKDALCDRLKPVLCTKDSFIVREGDPVNEMLFVMRGSLLTMTTNGGRTGFFNSVSLKAGDFCGEELLTWALDPQSSSNLPISTRTVRSETEVEAFALMPEDLKFVASQFRRLHSKQLRHIFRFYSLQWKTWAACFIQAAWRRHCRRKLEKALLEAEQCTLSEGGNSPSLVATIYVSRFAANALRNLRRNSPRNTRIPPRSPLLNLPKPMEPDFTSVNDGNSISNPGQALGKSRSLQLSDIMNRNPGKVVRFEDLEEGLSSFANKSGPLETIILDPQGLFVQKWNKIFLITCVFAMACDPLFFYIPVIDGIHKCLKLDVTLEIIACTLRTFTDLFYLLHIILQFRTGLVSSSSYVLGRVILIKDQAAIARRYLLSYFFVDILAVLPFLQMTVLYIIPKTSKVILKSVILIQYIPRLIRIYPLYKEVTRTSGIISATKWAGAAFNLFLYMLASHVIGAVWYLFAVDRQGRCWHNSCIGDGCHQLSLYCKDKNRVGNYRFNHSICNLVDPDEIQDSTVFNFGMYYDALRSEVVQSTNFITKLSYCFWWGLRSLSSLGQNLTTSTYIGENFFATFICIAGLALFSLLIGNMQKYLQSTIGVEEMNIRRREEVEQWMSYRLLPKDIKKRIRRYERYNLKEKRGVDEDKVIHNLPKDLRRDIKRHLGLDFLMRVPLFGVFDEHLKDYLCDRLKPVLYTQNSFIVREGDPVNEMLFVVRGSLLTMTTNGGRMGFFNSVSLKPGDFCGEELLNWALDPQSSSNLPISTWTVRSETEVEAFALMPEDLKFVASQFRRLHSKQLREIFRFYSRQWRTWAACFIQAEWRRHCRRKLEKALLEAEQCTLSEGGNSPSLVATC